MVATAGTRVVAGFRDSRRWGCRRVAIDAWGSDVAVIHRRDVRAVAALESTSPVGLWSCPSPRGSRSQDATTGPPRRSPLLSSSLPVTGLFSPSTAENVTVVVEGRASVETEAADATVRVEHGGEASFFTAVSTSDEFAVQARNVTSEAGGDVTITLRTEGSARLVIDAVRVAVDSDDDGLTDPVERTECIPSGLGCHPTDPHDEDSDGDTLEDGREADQRTVRFVAGQVVEYFDLPSKPDTPYSDSDGLNDSVEVRGWDVSVINQSVQLDGEVVTGALRWDHNNLTTDSIHVTSDPLVVDTDGDDAPDDVERTRLHTDPGKQITYLRTKRHQWKIVDALYQQWKAQQSRVNGSEGSITVSLTHLGLVPVGKRGSYLGELTLDDSTDDFDFVTLDSGPSVFDRLVFRSQDRMDGDLPSGPDIWVERTDTWLSNAREVGAGTKPWDPDTDDDGLTDGQELDGLTVARPGVQTIPSVFHRDTDASYETNATDPDTDGDGYWDGWIGVFGVGRSENVVLYMEHLQTGNGIGVGEVVREQTGVHRVNGSALTASAHGVNLTTSGGRYHSNVHVGELRWGSNPTNRGSEPDVNLDVEVDYLAGRNPFNVTNRHGETVVTAVEKNYELYGIDLDFHESDRIRQSKLRTIPKGIRNGSVVNITPFGFNQHELILVENRYHDDEERLHMLWGTRIRDDQPKAFIDRFRSYGTGTQGLALNNGAPGTSRVTLFQGDWGAFVASDALDNPNSVEEHQKAAVHEIGHVLGIGWADDVPLSFGRFQVPLVARHGKEVYSGRRRRPIDRTLEDVGLPSPSWSPMTNTNLINNFSNNNSRIPRLVFSIEELSTADRKTIPSTGE